MKRNLGKGERFGVSLFWASNKGVSGKENLDGSK
jgi:hypothetical protein